MNNNKDHITDLLIEKISGAIAPDDERLIDGLIATDAVVKAEWLAIKQKFSSAKTVDHLDHLNTAAQWATIAHGLKDSKVKSFRLQWFSAAAVLLLGFGTFYYFGNSNKGESVAALKASKQNGVQLTINNSQAVNLSASNGTINVGHLKLANAKKNLSYEATATEEVNWMMLAVPVKLDYKVKLADGTEVWLNAASSLKFPSGFPGKTREVYLEGEGFFKVAKNKDCPFIVHTGGADVRVLGTTFNIDAYHPQAMVTSLVEGKVMLTAGAQQHYLVPGHQSILNSDGFTDQLFDDQRELAWMTGEEYFNNMSVASIGEILERWYDIKLVTDDTAAAKLRLSGVIYKNKPLQFFISSLETTSGIKTTLIGNTLHVFK